MAHEPTVECGTCGYSYFIQTSKDACPKCGSPKLADRHLRAVENTPNDDPVGPYERLKARLLYGDDIRKVEPPAPLIEGMLFRPGTSAFYGPPGAHKTFLALDMALNLAHGTRWMGRSTVVGPVLYVVGEGVSGMGQRVDAWCQHHQKDVGSLVTWHNGAVNLLDYSHVDAITQLCEETKPVFTCIDTLARCTLGADENSARDMGAVVSALDRIRDASNGHVNVVHHSGKNLELGLRGNSALLGALDTVVKVTSSDDMINVIVEKQKDAATGLPLWLKAKPVGKSLILAAAGVTDADYESALTIYDALKSVASMDDPATPRVWQAAAGVPEPTFHRARRWLIEQHFVTVSGTGNMRRYAPTPTDMP